MKEKVREAKDLHKISWLVTSKKHRKWLTKSPDKKDAAEACNDFLILSLFTLFAIFYSKVSLSLAVEIAVNLIDYKRIIKTEKHKDLITEVSGHEMEPRVISCDISLISPQTTLSKSSHQ